MNILRSMTRVWVIYFRKIYEMIPSLRNTEKNRRYLINIINILIFILVMFFLVRNVVCPFLKEWLSTQSALPFLFLPIIGTVLIMSIFKFGEALAEDQNGDSSEE